MRRSHTFPLFLRLSAVSLLCAVSLNALAQGRQTVEKFRGPECFSTVIPNVVDSLGRVAGGREPGMQTFGAGDAVFLSISDRRLAVGQEYLLYRIDGTVRHPDTGALVGDAVNLLGRMEIMQIEGDRGLGRIVRSCSEIEAGDNLHPLLATDIEGEIDFPPADTETLVSVRESDATVVHGYSESLRARDGYDREDLGSWDTYAAGDVVTVDHGTLDGWRAGMRVLLYSTKAEVAAPNDPAEIEPVVVGQGIVIFALDATAALMIADGDGTVRIGSRARPLRRDIAER